MNRAQREAQRTAQVAVDEAAAAPPEVSTHVRNVMQSAPAGGPLRMLSAPSHAVPSPLVPVTRRAIPEQLEAAVAPYPGAHVPAEQVEATAPPAGAEAPPAVAEVPAPEPSMEVRIAEAARERTRQARQTGTLDLEAWTVMYAAHFAALEPVTDLTAAARDAVSLTDYAYGLTIGLVPARDDKTPDSE